jgi:hypothetical protein
MLTFIGIALPRRARTSAAAQTCSGEIASRAWDTTEIW